MRGIHRHLNYSNVMVTILAFIVLTGGTAVASVNRTPASASFDHHFNVIAKETSAKRTGPNTFRFKDKLFDPQNRRDQVGRDWVRCKFTTSQRAKCRAHIRLNGKIGGFGNIDVRGRIGPDDNRLNVVRGTHDFNGVAGKMLFYDLNMNTQRLHFDLVR